MEKEQTVKSLIARDKKELSQFILDLCGFTLDEAGFDAKNYVFYLHVAFRHQAILQSKEWQELCEAVAQSNLEQKPLDWSKDNEALQQRIASFSQSIVTEVTEASQDNFAIKLIKTSYLSTLDRARASCEQAIRQISVQKSQRLEDIMVSRVLSDESETQAFIDVLQKQRTYLDSLLGLPFIMEKLCLSVAKNQVGANYMPQKTAEMLANTLDTIHGALSINGTDARKDFLFKGLKLALAVTMPDIKISDHQLTKTIDEELLPFINKIIDSATKLEASKKKLLPKNAEGKDDAVSIARKALLEAMDVRLDSVQDILQETILKPINQCSQAVSAAVGTGLAVANIAMTDNKIDQALNISATFEHFDQIAAICAQIDPGLLPSWLTQANDYYQYLRKGLSTAGGVVQGTLDGLGAFYNYAISFIPAAVRNYLSQADTLTKVLNKVNKDESDFPSDKVMAYFAFYDLVKDGQITNPELKAKFFDAYMNEVVKADSKLKRESFEFEGYRQFEEQLEKKFNLKQSLVAGITQFGRQDPSQSLVFAVEKAFSSSNAQKLDVLILVNRLRFLEAEFNLKNAGPTFDELAAAYKATVGTEQEVLKDFSEEFLKPAMQRLMSQYQDKQLISTIEAQLELTNPETHKLREVYSKLKEKIILSSREVNFLKTHLRKYASPEVGNLDDLIAVLDSAKTLAAILDDKRKPEKTHWKTPAEESKMNAERSLDTAVPVINKLLKALQQRIDEQKESCEALKEVTSNPQIEELIAKKTQYIDALNGLINRLNKEINNPVSELRVHLFSLLSGDVNALIELGKKPLNDFKASSIPGKLLDLAWNVWPVATTESQQFNNTLTYRLLSYFLEGTPLGDVIDAENDYTAALNKNPIPSLMKQLNDPLAKINIIPSQEKIMDAIVANLVEQGKKPVLSWGTNYLKEMAANITHDQIVRFLPYPFLAELAIQAIKSEAVQARIAPIVNSLVNEYGSVVSDNVARITELARNQLYPILGIEIQKSIEEGAYNYALNPDKATPTERDSFAMYYLQFRELKKGTKDFNKEAAIGFLFPNLLENKKAEVQQEIMEKISDSFAVLDKTIPEVEIPQTDTIEETNRQLELLINNINFADKDNDKLIKLTLVNRLLVMSLEAAQQLQDPDQVTRLQSQIISKLSDTLEKINQLSAKAKEKVGIDGSLLEDMVVVEDKKMPEAMAEAISGANKRALKLELDQVGKRVKAAKATVDKAVIQHQAMLDGNAKEPRLGLSVLEWEYLKSSGFRKFFQALISGKNVLTTVLAWSALIGGVSIGLTAAKLFGLFVGAGVSAAGAVSGVGIAVFAGLAVMGFTWNLTMGIVENLGKFKAITMDPTLSVGERVGKVILLSLECVVNALFKTLLLGVLFPKIATFLGFSTLKGISDGIQVWPSEKVVANELTELESLQQDLVQLEKLVDNQINFIEKKINPNTKKDYEDRTAEITKLTDELNKKMATVEEVMNKAEPNDARFNYEAYQTTLNSYQENFAKLTAELATLKRLQDVQASQTTKEDLNEVPKEKQAEVVVVPKETATEKPVVVNLEAYKAKLKAVQPQLAEIGSKQQQGYLSYIWNFFKSPITEAPKVEEPKLQDQLQDQSLSNSSFYMVPQANAETDFEQSKLGLSTFVFLETSMVDGMLDTIAASNDSQVVVQENAPWRKNALNIDPDKKLNFLGGRKTPQAIGTPDQKPDFFPQQ